MPSAKKVISFAIIALLMAFVLIACSSKAPKQSTVNLPNAQNNPGASSAYPAATNAASTQAAYPATTQSEPTQPAYPVNSPLSITRPDGTTLSLEPNTLSNLQIITVKAGSTSVQGISINAVLAAAGITDYKQITLTGSNGSQTLTKDKVNDNVILKINDDRTLQLVSPDLPETNWLKAVSAIKAE